MSSPSASPEPLNSDEWHGKRIVILYWIITTISALVLALRFKARHLKHAVGVDDWLMLASWSFLLAIAIMSTLQNSMGGFDHLDSIPPQKIPQVLKVLWATQPFGILGIVPGKAAVAFTLIRIRGPAGSPLFRRSLYAVSAITLLVAIPTLLLQYLQCSPSAALWDPELRATASCLDPSIQANYAIFSGAWNSFVDFFLALMPATFIAKLKLDYKKRIVLCLLFGLSLITGIASIIKTTTLGELGARSDITWNLYDLYVWQGTEMFLIVVIGSAVLLKPIWDHYIGGKPGSTSMRSDRSYGRPPRKSFIRQPSSEPSSEVHSTIDAPRGAIRVKTTINHELHDLSGKVSSGDAGVITVAERG